MDIKWVECNLPWSHTDNDYFNEPLPDLSSKEIDRFGKTYEQIKKEFSVDHEYYSSKKEEISDKISSMLDDLDEKEYYEYCEKRDETIKDAMIELSKTDPKIKAKLDWHKFRDEYDVWADEQEEMIAWAKRQNDFLSSKKEKGIKLSFRGAGLNVPGTLIQLSNGSIELIGTINQLSGVCDCCSAFDSNMIVRRYAILFDWKAIEEDSK
jgi:hypothetical protein